jgi:4-amino-4-deoxy-L-arabinose transferase-like glycosyltransferase
MAINSNNGRAYQQYWLNDLTLLFVLIAIFYLLWLGSHALLTPDEARYSEIAREMVQTKDYITPRLNGTVFLDKPILYYWLQASAIKMFGLNEWSLRLWPAFIGVIGCLILYVGGRLLFNRRTGILAAIILATSPLYFGMSHYANLDLEVAVFISVSLLAFIIGIQNDNKQQTLWLWLAYICAGLAILTKGMMGLAFPMMIIGIWILLLNNWRIIKNMRLPSGLVLILIITLPWFYWVQQANPNFMDHFFLNQQVTRFVSKDFNDAEPFWFYLPIVLGGIFPWIIFLPQSIIYHYQLIKKDKTRYNAELFLLLWPLLIFIFFSIPHSKTIGYIVPVIPPLALLLGRYLDNLWSNLISNKFRVGLKAFIGLAILIVILEISLIANVKLFRLPSVKPLALIINRIAKPGDEVVTFYKYYQDLPLYTQRRITVVENWSTPAILQSDSWRREISDYFRSPAAHQWLITEPIFWQRWNSHQRMFVLIHKPEIQAFKEQAGAKAYLLGQYSNIYLYSNQP